VTGGNLVDNVNSHSFMTGQRQHGGQATHWAAGGPVETGRVRPDKGPPSSVVWRQLP
jgi:hypothetical protein